jgi:UCH-binding domain/Proteasome complex subunit Rpn13 ubiquitin receptor
MYSDLFDALGGGGPQAHTISASHNNASDEPKPLYSFKAGKVEMALQDNGKYSCVPDTRRGQVNLKYDEDSQLVWEWYDRREKCVVDTIPITDPVTLKRAAVPPSQDKDTNDRVYYWKLDNEYRMIWLQDKIEDPELISKANEILKKTKKAADEPGVADALRSPGNASTSSVSTTTRQVDALSNILENLGMPQGQPGEAASPASDAATAANGGGVHTLTLADLQGVMAGLQAPASGGAPPSLSDIVTPGAITELLKNESVKNRLLQELPEEQRSLEHLEENLRSPQVQQTLRSLTAALVPDDNGSMDAYHSVLANFELDAADGQRALAESNNPIQAFLDCVLANVEKEKKEESNDQEMEED